MKSIKYILTIIFTSQLMLAQSIDIGTGATIDVGTGADICAGTYGNIIINGTITGGGTQCGQIPLPVELTSFTAVVKNNIVNLNWQTATEVNNYGFEVERTSPLPPPYEGGGGETGGGWEKIGFVEGNGNSNSPKVYSFVDKNLIGGSKFLYRLKQIDNDGQFEYSDVVEVEIVPTEFALYQNYPNPFNPATKIRYQLPRESKVTIMIYDMLGAEVMTLINESKEPGVYEVDLNISHLSSGTYIYRIVAGNFVDTKKMILLK